MPQEKKNCDERGRGKGRGRGRGRGQVKRPEKVDYAVAGPSTRTYEEEYAEIKKKMTQTKNILKKMDPSVKEELIQRKRMKEISRTLLPDAPPRKRARKQQSPVRTECHLIEGTPETPPAPKLQPWQIRMQSPTLQAFEKREDCFSPSSTISSIMELQVDWTTGQIKNPDENPSVSFLLEDVPPSVSKSPTLDPILVKHINEGIKGKDTKEIDESLAHWLEDLSDEEIEAQETLDRPEQDSYLDPAHIIEDLDQDVQAFVANEDNASDRLMTNLLSADHISFDWSHDKQTFKGTREPFTGQSGPTFNVTNETKPLDIFLKFFDQDLLHLLATQTNKYATKVIDSKLTEHSRLNYYKNVDEREMAIFIAILILQGLAPIPVEKDYWKENGYLTLKYFKDIMPYNRFILLKRLIHFSNQTDFTGLTNDEMKLRKIWPVLDFLKKKFCTLYFPGQNIAIDESLLKWEGRLSFAQKIATKAAKVGVKSYELCESATGYLWNFFIYCGKQTDDEDEKDTDQISDTDKTVPPIPTNATAKIVCDLAKPLFNRGHTIVMDNFYNSPLLARYLKSQKTDCYGTLRVNREFVPEAIKSISKNELRSGEMVQSFCHDLHAMMWRDANVVSMLSTYHKGGVGGKEKYGKYKYKPEIVLDYNLAMGGVDKKDQLLSAFPIERVRNLVWYKKVFRRLLNVTLLNAFVIYKTRHTNATQRRFRTEIAEDLIKVMRPPVIARPIPVVVKKYVIGPKKNTMRPILEGNHFIGIGSSKYSSCMWCKKSRSKYICKQCNVTLCFEICFEEYHTVSEPRHT